MLFGGDRAAYRRVFCEAWRKHLAGEALSAQEVEIAAVARAHPEYHGILEDPDRALDADWLPEHGESNPFLHLAMHLAVREQAAADRPASITDIYRRLRRRTGSELEAEHEMIECLAEALWHAQRAGQTAPDEAGYLDCLRRRAGKR